MKEKIQKLKDLPNTHKGTASGLCDAVCILFVVMIFLACLALKLKVDAIWFIGGVGVAKLVGTVVFYKWAASVQKHS